MSRLPSAFGAWLLAATAAATGIEINFDNFTGLDQFEQHPQENSFFGVFQNDQSGVGGSGGISPPGVSVDLTHQVRFDLSETNETITASVAFELDSTSIPSGQSSVTLAEVYLTTGLTSPPRNSSAYYLTGTVSRGNFGFELAVGGGLPDSTFLILPSLTTPLPSLSLGNWYELEFDVTPRSTGVELDQSASLWNLGPNGTSTPQFVGAVNRGLLSDSRIDFKGQPDWYAGFTAAENAGALDNFRLEAPGVGPLVGVAEIAPAQDAELLPGEAFSLGNLNATSLVVDGGLGSRPRRDALIEFPLDQIPPGANLLSARLELERQFSNEITIDALGYVGDGVIALEDEFAATTSIGFGVVDASLVGPLEIPLEVGFIQLLLDNGDGLGVRARSRFLNEFNQFYSSESSFGAPPTLVVEYELGGDFNGDGTVDAADFTVWRDGLGSEYSVADYETWRATFGQMLAPPAAIESAAAPEPGGSAVIAAALAACPTAAGSRGRRRWIAAPARSA
ncbi:MAG: hypothetical protein AAGJ46_04815 [Planctomycetota bacterium]